jgi:hypothetical protein
MTQMTLIGYIVICAPFFACQLAEALQFLSDLSLVETWKVAELIK